VALLFALLGASPAALAAQDQTDPLSAALAHEDGRRWPEAARAYRLLLAQALRADDGGDLVALSLLGLERVWHESALRDSVLPVVEEVLLVRPADPVARTIQFRSLSITSRDEALRAAFLGWRRAAPDESAPWREYVRTLMSMGRPLAADSVLADAARVLRRRSEFPGEAAQVAIALERWRDAAIAWRGALAQAPWQETAAAYALQRAPESARDSVREVLLETPVALGPRRLLATLELTWNDARRAWAALAPVPPDDSVRAAWAEFAEQAEVRLAFGVAQATWTALYAGRTGTAEQGVRAAAAALRAGAPAEALALADRAGRSLDAPTRAQRLLPVEVRALGELGRAAEAEARVRAAAAHLDDDARAELARPLVSAWLRAGEVARARAVADAAGALDDDATIGWLALYEGDLAQARKRLVRAPTRDAALTDALAVLARTRVTVHRGLGLAFLALAQRDTTAALGRFAALADSLPDAAPVLLATAARLASASGARARAVRYWEGIATQHATSAEAPEALLEWARALVREGDAAGAALRYETLIIDHAGSAMVPQARRELERLRGRVPPAR
jgi:hypothetical protein